MYKLFFFFFSIFFSPQGEVSLSALRFYSIQSDSACPQNFSTGRDAGFEPWTTASVVWNERIKNEKKNLSLFLFCFVFKYLVADFLTLALFSGWALCEEPCRGGRLCQKRRIHPPPPFHILHHPADPRQ